MTSITAGDDKLVNTYLTNDQDISTVTLLEGGGWVVTWESFAQDGSNWSVYQQIYNANGTAIGGETRVNTYTANGQWSHHTVALKGGGWLVTWHSDGQDDSGYGVYQQAYKADGSVLGSETRVNTLTDGAQRDEQVQVLAGGGWVIVWRSSTPDGLDSDVYQQAYKADGTVLGAETRVNTYLPGYEGGPQVAALTGGGWVVTWQSNDGQDGSGSGVYQQIYKGDGTALGSETRVNTHTVGGQYYVQIAALTGGGWVVTWETDPQDTTGISIGQQAYNADGSPMGGETHANTHQAILFTKRQVTALASGGWVVTWEAQGLNGAFTTGIYQQAYHADGSVLGGETLVNTTVAGNHKGPVVAALGDGWVVTWASYSPTGDSKGADVYQQVYNANGLPLGSETRVSTHDAKFQYDQSVTALGADTWAVTWQSGDSTGDIYQRVFHLSRSAASVRYDLNGDGKADIVWQNDDGTAVIWTMNGAAIASAAGLGNPGAAWKIRAVADLDGDGKSDLVWQSDNGVGVVYLMDGSTIASIAGLGYPGTAWKIKAAGDLNGDGKADIVWQNDDGTAVVYFMDGGTITASAGLGNPGAAWKIKSVADFNGDGKADILWQNDNGAAVIYLMNGSTVTSSAGIGNPGANWHIRDAADFDGDGRADILWQSDDYTAVIWFMNGSAVSSVGGVGNPGGGWTVKSTGDMDGDGKADITWQVKDGNTAAWLMNGATVTSYAGLGNSGASWHVVAG